MMKGRGMNAATYFAKVIWFIWQTTTVDLISTCVP
jgi:hypothetical protein